MNHNFATVTEDHSIVYAPDTLGRSLRKPSAWQYHQAGYWEIENQSVTPPDGMQVVWLDLYDLVTIQEEHVPAADENGDLLDPDDEYQPLLKVVRQRYEFKPIPVYEPTVDDYNRAVEDHLMAERMERGYDTREPSLYINSSVHRWSQDAVDWVRHVDAVMTFALGVLNGWEKTHEVMSLDEFRAAIPRIEWTEKDND